MTKPSGLRLSLLFALFAQLASGATFLGFNAGPFYSIVGSTSSPTEPNYLQVSFAEAFSFDTFVTITSSDPSRLIIIGGGVTVPTGQTTATVLVSSFALGSVTVTANFQDTVATTSVQVVPEIPVVPSLKVTPLTGAVQLTWPTNATGYLLETNSLPTNPAGWGVLTTNYSLIATDYSVTTPTAGAAMFFRLRQP